MYPHTFRPTTKCTVDDARGHQVGNLNLQIFKPLLGLSFNGPQVKIVNYDVPNQAGAIMRGLVETAVPTTLDLRPGPAYWKDGLIPFLVLDEDPNALVWRWLDAVPWSYGAGRRLWSFFAAVDYVAPPPPPPPTPITLGPSAPTAPVVATGTVYTATIAALASGYVYATIPTGTGYTIATLTGTTPSVTATVQGGPHAAPGPIEATLSSSPSSAGVMGVSHTGPDALLKLTNPTGSPVTANFTITVP